MPKMTREEVIQLLTLISSNYENFMIGDATRKKMMIELWTESLEDIDFEEAKTALKSHFRESVYVPKIADIYQRVINKKLPQFPDPVDEFNKVLKAIGTYGYNRVIEAMDSFHPYTRKVVEMNGGFRKFCMANVDDEISDRKHFTETYNRLIEREIRNIKDGGVSLLQLVEKKEPTKIDVTIQSVIKRIE